MLFKRFLASAFACALILVTSACGAVAAQEAQAAVASGIQPGPANPQRVMARWDKVTIKNLGWINGPLKTEILPLFATRNLSQVPRWTTVEVLRPVSAASVTQDLLPPGP